jgi:hypothetical protein
MGTSQLLKDNVYLNFLSKLFFSGAVYCTVYTSRFLQGYFQLFYKQKKPYFFATSGAAEISHFLQGYLQL